MGCCTSIQPHEFDVFEGADEAKKPPKQVAIVCNPMSGGRKGLDRLLLVTKELDRSGVAYKIHQTKYSGHASEIAADLMKGWIQIGSPDVDAMLSIGGDGTLHEIVNGMLRALVQKQSIDKQKSGAAAKSEGEGEGDSANASAGRESTEEATSRADAGAGARAKSTDVARLIADARQFMPPLGIIPCGSGNTVAHTLGWHTPEEGIRRALTGVVRRIDAIAVCDASERSVVGGGATGCETPTSTPVAAASASGSQPKGTGGAVDGTGGAGGSGGAAGAATGGNADGKEEHVKGSIEQGGEQKKEEEEEEEGSSSTAEGTVGEAPGGRPAVSAGGAAGAASSTADPGIPSQGHIPEPIIFSLNMIGWGLGTAVMRSADGLRCCCGGAAYNCAAYMQLIENPTYGAELLMPQGQWVERASGNKEEREENEGEAAAGKYAGSELDNASNRGGGGAGGTAGEGGDGSWAVVERARYVMIQAQTTVHMGEKMAFAPHAKVDDGLMDVVVMHGGSGRLRLVHMMDLAKANGKHADEEVPETAYYATPELIIRPLPAEAFGTTGGGAGGGAGGGGGAPARIPRIEAGPPSAEMMHGLNSLNVDGELAGTSPALLRVIGGLLPVLVGPCDSKGHAVCLPGSGVGVGR